MKVASTDHNQTNNLTSLIICFSKQRIYFHFFFVNVKTNMGFFYFINPRNPLHVLVPGERLSK